MQRVKNSLWAKMAAVLLALALVVGLIPAGFLQVQAADELCGTVESVETEGVTGTIDSSDSQNVTVKYEGVGTTIKWLQEDSSVGRNTAGYYIGAIMTAPESVAETATVKNPEGESKGVSATYYMWQLIDELTFSTDSHTYKWEYDWDADGIYEQTVTFTIDSTTVGLDTEDSVKPVVETAVPDKSSWTNEPVTVSGLVSDNKSGVKAVYYKKAVEGAEINTASLTGNTYTFTILQEDYNSKYIVFCEDNAGNTSAEKEVTVQIDCTEPTISAAANISGWTNGDVIIEGVANDTASGIDQIFYKKEGGSASVVTDFTVETGKYKITIPADDYQGNYVVYCIDKAGNISEDSIVSVKMDNVKPSLSDIQPENTTWTNQSVTIEGTIDADLSGVAGVYYQKGDAGEKQPVTVSENRFSFEINEEEYDGAYKIFCQDNAGNESVKYQVLVQMDKKECQVITANANPNGWTNQDVTVAGKITLKKSGIKKVYYQIGDDATKYDVDSFDSVTGTYSTVISNRNYMGEIKIDYEDNAGNKSAQLSVDVYMDVTKPKVTSVLVSNPNWTNGTVTISGIVSDSASGVKTVFCKDANGNVKETSPNADNGYQFVIDPQDYEGTYQIYCIDKAGNVSDISEATTVSVKMDATKPTITATADETNWTNGTVTISGTISDNLSKVKSVICEKTGTTEQKSVTIDIVAGTYSVELQPENYCGTYTVYCIDNAGNESEKQTVEVRMDVEKPQISDATPIFGDQEWINTDITITGKAADINPGAADISKVSGVFFKQNGKEDTEAEAATYTAETDTFSFVIPKQNYKGKYLIYCVDHAGNRSGDFVLSVFMDKDRCVIKSAIAEPSTWTNGEVIISGKVWDNLSGVEKVSYRKDGEIISNEVDTVLIPEEADYTYSYKVTIPKQDYQGKYLLTCSDKAGNGVETPAEVSVMMDQTKPEITEAEADKTDWTNEKVTIRGTVSDNLSGVAKIYYQKGLSGEEVEITNNSNTFELPILPQNYEGSYYFWCKDNAGNISDKAEVKVKMDNTPPSNTELISGGKTWKNVINSLTLGLFFNQDQNVVVNTEDNLSGIKTVRGLEKNIQSGDAIDVGILEAESGWTVLKNVENEKELSLSGVRTQIAKTPNKNVIYCVEVTDYAGNIVYVTSDGMIFDTTNPAGALTDNKVVLPQEAATHEVGVDLNQRPLFGAADVKDVDGKRVIPFDVKITEETINGVLQSGIKEINYKVESKDRAGDAYAITQSDTMYEWNQTDSLKTEFTDVINVDAEQNNCNYVKVTVDVTDNAGNSHSETYELAIDITVPTIAMKYVNNKVVGTEGKGGRGYFDAERTLTVTYTERTENWSRAKAEEVLKKTVAKDAKGNNVVYEVEWKDLPGTISDEDVHVATIRFKDKVHYNVEKPTYTDAAGNTAGEPSIPEETKYPYVFSIDKADEKDSEGTIKVLGESWINKFFNTITFGRFDLFSNANETVEISVADDFSGIRKVEYIEKEYTEGVQIIKSRSENFAEYPEWDHAKTYEFTEDRKLTPEIESQTISIGEKDAKNVVVYIRVTDYAGYVKYYSTEGLIFDTVAPEKGLKDGEEDKLVLPADSTMRTVPGTKKPLYGIEEVGEDGVVAFSVKVTEKTLENVVQEATETEDAVVERRLQSGIQQITYKVDSKDRKEHAYRTTQSGTLYQWNHTDPLKTEYTGNKIINVDAEQNNYNYVKVTVKVVDNAGNSVEETYEFAIDITKPTVAVDFTDDTPVYEEDGCGYYVDERYAEITYTERSENWLRPADTDVIEALNIAGEVMNSGTAYHVEWEDSTGAESDQDKHIAHVTFYAEKNSTMEKVYKDARYSIDTSCTDAAGNSSQGTTMDENDTYPICFVIDTVNPEVVGIKYSQPITSTVLNALTFNYYDSNVTVTVTTKDMTSGVNAFDYEGLLDSNISSKNKDVIKTVIANAEIIPQTKEGGQKTGEFVVKFQIPKSALTELNSFRGTVKVNAFDRCNNSVEKHDNVRLVADVIPPVAKVTFDEPVKEANDVSYYDGAFTATISIDEANFYAEDVDIRVNDSRVRPTDWTQNGDVWTSHVTFTEEDDYVLTVNYTDRSGNVMTAYKSNQKTLDTTEPVIALSNVKHESANNGEKIGFILTITDKNIALEDVKPQIVAVVRKGDNRTNYTYETVEIDLGTATTSTNEKGETVYTYVVENLEIDGYYSLVCTATDHANHTVSNIGTEDADGQNETVETVNFSVNREGSVFWIETEHTDKYAKNPEEKLVNQLNNAYANAEVTVSLHEVNVDKVDDLKEADKRTVLTLNDGSKANNIELVENSNGTGNYKRNVEIGDGGWYETIYTLDNEYFKNDGTYSLNIITYDMALNSNVNTKSEEEGTIKFVVDRTNPVISSNVKNEQSIEENKYTVEFKIADVNLNTDTVVVTLNGKNIKCEEVGSNTYQFTLEEAQWKDAFRGNLSDDFTIEAADMAGNSAEIYTRKNVTVTDDKVLQAAAFLINHPVWFGITIAGVISVIGLFGGLIIFKRRRINL